MKQSSPQNRTLDEYEPEDPDEPFPLFSPTVRRLSEADLPLQGRITGSASIDTLVRVGLEKDLLEAEAAAPGAGGAAGPGSLRRRRRVLILHDFQPCVDDELAVTRGQSVTVLYRENDWL